MLPEKAGKYDFEVGMYRPPSEGGSSSLLLRFTRNCPWNKCTFCGMYKHEKFSLRTVEEIKADIDSIAGLIKEMQSLSLELGHAGQINRDTIIAMIEKEPELNTSQGFGMILNWLSSGGKTVFLQDGNSLMMASEKLVHVLKYLRNAFPSLERCTTYARSKTLSRKSLEELTGIRKAGLDRLHVGLETGDDVTLKTINKGAAAQEMIAMGNKAKQAGFKLSVTVLLGIAGPDRSQIHAQETGRVLSAIDPNYVGALSLMLIPGTPIYRDYEAGKFQYRTVTTKQIFSRLNIKLSGVQNRRNHLARNKTRPD